MVAFELEDVEGLEKHVKGLPADLLIDICKGFVAALNADATGTARLTARQREMAIKAGIFLSACAKVGLDAMIDEATGYLSCLRLWPAQRHYLASSPPEKCYRCIRSSCYPKSPDPEQR